MFMKRLVFFVVSFLFLSCICSWRVSPKRHPGSQARGNVFAGGFLAATISLFPVSSNAQIPMMEDFYQGSGTVAVKKGDSAAPVVAVEPQTVFSIDDLSSRLTRIEGYIKKEAWDNILLETKQIKLVPKKYLGYGSVSSMAQEIGGGITSSKGTEFEILRDDLAFQLNQLSDISLANRVIFFNSLDLQQVQQLKDSSVDGAADGSPVEEATSVLGEARSILYRMNKLF